MNQESVTRAVRKTFGEAVDLHDHARLAFEHAWPAFEPAHGLEGGQLPLSLRDAEFERAEHLASASRALETGVLPARTSGVDELAHLLSRVAATPEELQAVRRLPSKQALRALREMPRKKGRLTRQKSATRARAEESRESGGLTSPSRLALVTARIRHAIQSTHGKNRADAYERARDQLQRALLEEARKYWAGVRAIRTVTGRTRSTRSSRTT